MKSGKWKNTLIKFAEAVISTATLVFAISMIIPIYVIRDMDSETVKTIGKSFHVNPIYVMVVFGLTGILFLIDIFGWRPTFRAMRIKNSIVSVSWFVTGILFLLLPEKKICFLLGYAVIFLSAISGKILTMLHEKSIRNFGSSIGSLLLLGGALVYLLAMSPGFQESANYILMAVILAGEALVRIIRIAFSQIQLGVLRKILRRTYAHEILLGLILLIVAFSFVFIAVEPGLKSYEDALWYCFAIVTTIGFGDFSATTFLSRLLSVILGIYGIIVVALITSIIVNFYNEVKDKNEEEEITEEIKAEVKKADVRKSPESERRDTP